LTGGNGTNDLQKSAISNQQDLGNPMYSSNLFRQQQQQYFDSKLLIFIPIKKILKRIAN